MLTRLALESPAAAGDRGAVARATVLRPRLPGGRNNDTRVP